MGSTRLRLPARGPVSRRTAKQVLKALRKHVRGCRIDLDEFRVGLEVEREHRDLTRLDALQTGRIAAAHLCEKSGRGYYERLKRYVER